MSSGKKTFIVECTMEERWIPYFCSFLKQLEYNGIIGHSSQISMYADGDRDFRPKFNIDIDFQKQDGITTEYIFAPVELMYDAG